MDGLTKRAIDALPLENLSKVPINVENLLYFPSWAGKYSQKSNLENLLYFPAWAGKYSQKSGLGRTFGGIFLQNVHAVGSKLRGRLLLHAHRVAVRVAVVAQAGTTEEARCRVDAE